MTSRIHGFAHASRTLPPALHAHDVFLFDCDNTLLDNDFALAFLRLAQPHDA